MSALHLYTRAILTTCRKESSFESTFTSYVNSVVASRRESGDTGALSESLETLAKTSLRFTHPLMWSLVFEVKPDRLVADVEAWLSSAEHERLKPRVFVGKKSSMLSPQLSLYLLITTIMTSVFSPHLLHLLFTITIFKSWLKPMESLDASTT